MPTYQYKCFNKDKECNHQFERVQSIKDEKIKECPKCKEQTLERIISQTSFILKGTGWHNKGGY